jgi:hypothetical protein
MTLKSKTCKFKVVRSICKSELAWHRTFVDVECNGNCAASSSACKLKYSQALHWSLIVNFSPKLQYAYMSGWVSTEFHYA